MTTTPDIYENAHFGYDPTVPETVEFLAPDERPALPSSAQVDDSYLPPVQRQTTPSCAAWASTYGLATFTAARAGNYSPQSPAQQASPAYIYIQVMKEDGQQQTCTGSSMTSYVAILDKGGTATMQQAPEEPCSTLWQDYGTQTLAPDAAFNVGTVSAVKSTDLDSIKTILLLGGALAF